MAVNPGGGREGLAGREWEEFMAALGIWEKKGGSVKWEVVGGGRVNFDSMEAISFMEMSL